MQSSLQEKRVSTEALRRRHEFQNPSATWLAFGAGLVVLMILVSLFVSSELVRGWAKTRPMDANVHLRGTIIAPDLELLHRFPRPNLQVSPHEDLLRLRTREDAELNQYRWIDRKSGVVGLPIERAMELLAQRGLPTRPRNGKARTGQSEFELARERNLQK